MESQSHGFATTFADRIRSPKDIRRDNTLLNQEPGQALIINFRRSTLSTQASISNKTAVSVKNEKC
ncbi:hypothetical protein BJY04DRAFT_177788 [Aspergillus karnatakaensis]|uniref:uncharacterized protein n=1 Tax=Aspergillus karnatakaensis TaxID=1810916 RepID=UPI003CCC9185